jgi:hypothetical protein
VNCFPNQDKEHKTSKISDKIYCLPAPAVYDRQRLLTLCSGYLNFFGPFFPAWRKTAGLMPGKGFSLRKMFRYASRVSTGKVVLITYMLAIFCIANEGFCQENVPSPETATTATEDSEKNEEADSEIWQKIWGEKSENAVLMGMWSIHLKGSGEYFGGSGESNEQNKLIGIVYNGIGAGTFINSHDERSWLIALGRNVYSRELAENTRLDVGYRVGPLYGYGDSLPNLGKVSLFGAGTISFSWYIFGIDIMVIPIGVVTGGFRINF